MSLPFAERPLSPMSTKILALKRRQNPWRLGTVCFRATENARKPVQFRIPSARSGSRLQAVRPPIPKLSASTRDAAASQGPSPARTQHGRLPTEARNRSGRSRGPSTSPGFSCPRSAAPPAPPPPPAAAAGCSADTASPGRPPDRLRGYF